MDDRYTEDGRVKYMRGGTTIFKKIPENSAKAVYICSNEKGTGFVRKMYNRNKPFIGGLITATEFKSAIDAASVLTAKVYSHNRKKDVEGISYAQQNVLIFLIVLAIIYFVLLFSGVRSNDNDIKLSSFFTLAIVAFIALVNLVFNFMQKPDKYTPFKDMVRKTLIGFFERLNKKYEETGLSFEVTDNHFYIEIKIRDELARKYRQQQGWELSADAEWDEEEEDYQALYYD